MAKHRKPHPLSESLRAAVRADGRAIYAIALAAGVEDASLRRFMKGVRGLDGINMERLAAELKLELRPMSDER